MKPALPLCLGLLAVLALPLHSQNLFSIDFETATAGQEVSTLGFFAYVGESPAVGDAPTQLNQVSASGNPGNAIEVTVDSTDGAGWWGGIGGPMAAPNTSDLSQLTLSLDVAGSGFTPGTDAVNIIFEQDDGDGNDQWSFIYNLTAENTWQSFSATLDQFNSWGDGTLDTTNTVGVVVQFWGSDSTWGADTGNTVMLDNISFVSTVPEPATVAAVIGGIAFALVILHRRRGR